MSKIKVVTDNPKYFDRYTVYFIDGTFLSLSTNCDSPQGYSQWGQWQELPATATEEKEISFDGLPLNVQQHVLRRMKE